MDKKEKIIEGLMCEVTDDRHEPSKLKQPIDRPDTGTYQMHRDSKIEDTATDVYYKTECKIPDSKVAIPTEDAVKEAKEWVDDINKK